jgi:hypothetical protein
MAKLKKFLLRYYPPGVILEYESGGQLLQKSIDLLDLTPEDDVEVVLNHVMRQVTALRSLQLLLGTEGRVGTRPRLRSDRRLGYGARLVLLPASSPRYVLLRSLVDKLQIHSTKPKSGGWVPPPGES